MNNPINKPTETELTIQTSSQLETYLASIKISDSNLLLVNKLLRKKLKSLVRKTKDTDLIAKTELALNFLEERKLNLEMHLLALSLVCEQVINWPTLIRFTYKSITEFYKIVDSVNENKSLSIFEIFFSNRNLKAA